uniref:Uncharacterized protein n=1 Tax=Octopus bimaculoides TaxID=37653 RepID=A0A0L8H6I0_OCTBM
MRLKVAHPLVDGACGSNQKHTLLSIYSYRIFYYIHLCTYEENVTLGSKKHGEHEIMVTQNIVLIKKNG